MTYEMLIGEAPFFDEEESAMYVKIVKSKLKFPKEVPLSKECTDFIERLLTKDPAKRLGSSGDFQEVLSHPFLRDIDVVKL